jgi:beta-glucosidase/6-phospho-beta-glucosidase/beta-galactosidase
LTGSNGNGDALFSLSPGGFAWATGIEDTFIGQTERIGERPLDEYALTHHYIHWREDIDRAARLGVRAMRYGIPWYKVEPASGVFDWGWVDQVLEYIARKGIAVIVDLMHYGTPLWLDNQFLNSSYPQRVAAYAAEFARRYKHFVSSYTPLNEPWITVAFTGLHGIWPPYLRGDDGAVKILRSVARGIVLTVDAIRAEDPAAVIVSVDAAGETLAASPELEDAAALAIARTFVATDLVMGRVDDGHPLYGWLLRNGMQEADLAWHAGRAVQPDIVGVNYYPETSVSSLRKVNGEFTGHHIWGGADGLSRSLRAFALRYGRPVMVTETSTNGSLELRERWLAESLAVIPALRSEGVPLVGYTWWPLFDLIDWSYRHGARPLEEFVTRLGPPTLDVEQIAAFTKALHWTTLEQLPLEAYLAPMGLYQLQMQFDGTFARVPTYLVEQYKEHIARPDSVGEVGTQAEASAERR